MSHPIENINEKKLFFKENQMKIPELLNIITEMKNSLQGLNRRFELAEE